MRNCVSNDTENKLQHISDKILFTYRYQFSLIGTTRSHLLAELVIGLICYYQLLLPMNISQIRLKLQPSSGESDKEFVKKQILILCNINSSDLHSIRTCFLTNSLSLPPDEGWSFSQNVGTFSTILLTLLHFLTRVTFYESPQVTGTFLKYNHYLVKNCILHIN